MTADQAIERWGGAEKPEFRRGYQDGWSGLKIDRDALRGLYGQGYVIGHYDCWREATNAQA